MDRNPDLPGVYERQYDEEVCFCHWDGRHWGYSEDTPDDAFAFRLYISRHKDLPWRGLAEKPE